MNSKLLFFSFLISLAFFSSLYSTISIDPVVVETEVVAGKSAKGFFKVTNVSEKPVIVKVEPEKWLKFTRDDIDINEWLSIKPIEFVLKPGKHKKVKYSIKLPKHITGEVMAMVFFSTPYISGTTEVGFAARIGASLSATVKGTEIVNAVIEEVTVSRQKNDGISVSIVIENRGNVHIRPRGKVFIKDKIGGTKELDIQYGQPVYPKGSSTFYAISKDKFPDGDYDIETVVNYSRTDEKKIVNRIVKREIYQ